MSDKLENNTPVGNVDSENNAPVGNVDSENNAPVGNVDSENNAPVGNVDSENNAPVGNVDSENNAPVGNVDSENDTPIGNADSENNAPVGNVDSENNAPVGNVDSENNAPVGNVDSAMFDNKECRIIASMMEKELTVPDTYPITLKSLVLACNQKSNREPVMALTEGEVGHICNGLKERDVVEIDFGERAYRYNHKIKRLLSIDKNQQALLTVMMMRTPQTLNDLKARTARMCDFSDTGEIKSVLESLIEREQPLVKLIPKGMGQREDRYTHLLSGEVLIPNMARPLPVYNKTDDSVRIAELEQQVAGLLKRVEQLEQHNGQST